jgi:predicted RNA-binding Zn-ribbon protein involved in translation (DUF1610 family)
MISPVTVKFSCKKCGSEVFVTAAKPKTLADFYGAVCQNCGTTVTQDDIKAQTLKIAGEAARDAFRKSGLK